MSVETPIHGLSVPNASYSNIGGWEKSNIRNWLNSTIFTSMNNKEYIKPTDEEKILFLLDHLNKLVKLKGEKIAILEMRSLAAWYVKGMKNSKEFKLKLVNITTRKEFEEIVYECFGIKAS